MRHLSELQSAVCPIAVHGSYRSRRRSSFPSSHPLNTGRFAYSSVYASSFVRVFQRQFDFTSKKKKKTKWQRGSKPPDSESVDDVPPLRGGIDIQQAAGESTVFPLMRLRALATGAGIWLIWHSIGRLTHDSHARIHPRTYEIRKHCRIRRPWTRAVKSSEGSGCDVLCKERAQHSLQRVGRQRRRRRRAMTYTCVTIAIRHHSA